MDQSKIDSFPFREEAAVELMEPNRWEETSMEVLESYRKLIQENIEYEYLNQEYPYDQEMLNEIVELIVETVCARRKNTRIAGSDFCHEIVRSRLLKLNAEHIRMVLNGLKENTTKIRNIKQYLLTSLYNAPSTISSYYTARVNHDMYGR